MDRGNKRRWLHMPSPAMIVACVALFIALGGTSYAAATLAANSVGTKQLKKNAVSSAKIKNAAVTGTKVKDGTLTGAKIADATITTAKLTDASVTGAKLADASVDAAKMGSIPGARIQLTTATEIPSQELNTRLSFDATPDFNVGGVYDAANPTRLTAPIAGRYLITASARWAANLTGRRLIAINLDFPAADWKQIARSNVSGWSVGPDFYPEQNVQTVYQLKAGDYVEMWVAQNSGVALKLNAGAGAPPNAVTFSLQWLAP
jgi:hypothetical protein